MEVAKTSRNVMHSSSLDPRFFLDQHQLFLNILAYPELKLTCYNAEKQTIPSMRACPTVIKPTDQRNTGSAQELLLLESV